MLAKIFQNKWVVRMSLWLAIWNLIAWGGGSFKIIQASWLYQERSMGKFGRSRRRDRGNRFVAWQCTTICKRTICGWG